MEWDDLRYLLALARFSTLGGAAQHLGVNYTTVSRRINSLQERAGVRLIEKTGRRYTLTNAGLDAVQAAEEMEQHTQNLERKWFGQDARLVGTLRVTTVDVLGVFYAQTFAEFSALYPGIELELITDNRMANLTKRQADIAIRITSSPPENLVGRRIAHLTYKIFGAVSLLEKFGEDRDLSDYPWLHWDEAQGAVITDQWMKRHVPDATITARLDSALVMLALARSGAGLCILPSLLATHFPDLRALQDAPEEFNTDIWLLTHEELRNAARVRAMMDHMANAQPRWL